MKKKALKKTNILAFIVLVSSIIIVSCNDEAQNNAVLKENIEKKINIEELTYKRPYSSNSFWNTPIPKDAKVHKKSNEWIQRLLDLPQSNQNRLLSDPTQYAFPVYYVNENTQKVTVVMQDLAGEGKYFSEYVSDTERLSKGKGAVINDIPLPKNITLVTDTDGWIILLDLDTGYEWGFWRLRKKDDKYYASNGYRYNINWSGRFADGKAGRGAGLPYLGGLVKKEEIEAGKIEHSLAFGYHWPAGKDTNDKRIYVYPASKSDGLGHPYKDMPEGTLLQLNPSIDLTKYNLSKEGIIIAKALQKYGMYVVDNSGSSKIYIENEKTAKWNGAIHKETVAKIPFSDFRVLEPSQK